MPKNELENKKGKSFKNVDELFKDFELQLVKNNIKDSLLQIMRAPNLFVQIKYFCWLTKMKTL